jgi:hypothetical protein
VEGSGPSETLQRCCRLCGFDERNDVLVIVEANKVVFGMLLHPLPRVVGAKLVPGVEKVRNLVGLQMRYSKLDRMRVMSPSSMPISPCAPDWWMTLELSVVVGPGRTPA